MPKDQSNCITTWLSFFFSCHKLNVMASLIFWSKLSPQLSQRAFSSVEPHSHLQQSTSLLCLQITIETFFLQYFIANLWCCKWSDFNLSNILFCHQLFQCTFPKLRQKWPEVSKGEFMYTWLFFFPSIKM